MTESIDIIYCYRDRELDHVRASLDSLSAQTDKRFKVTFVDYGSSIEKQKAVSSLCHNYSFCEYHFINSRGKMWSRGDALNHGILLSKSDLLFFSDIDMLFIPECIANLHTLAENKLAYFFAVGYLNKKDTQQAQKGNMSTLVYTKSTEDALGMLLAPRTVLESVNGYNNFYALWGLEDNDLKRRIEESGFQTQHISDVWLLHQYHEPVPQSKSLPEGWIQFMKDHFQKEEENKNGLTQIDFNKERPAEKQFLANTIQYIRIRSRKLHLRHVLLQACGQSGTYAFSCEAIHPDNPGFIQKNRVRLSQFLKSIGIHADLLSAYRDQYISNKEILDEILFVLKSSEALIEDYYIHEERDEVKLILVIK